ncbi:MAG: LytTR family transcriptional regulator [Clostridia bacterium]|nr:LytTR family transcriptional regulator [Clostridia bacterium]
MPSLVRKELHMKCTRIFDPKRREVIIYTDKPNALTDKIEELCREDPPDLIGYDGGAILPIRPSDVSCFTIEGGRLFAITDGARLQIRSTLSALEARLGDGFVRLNQSSLANIKRIARFDVSVGAGLIVIFKDGYRDYVSRRQIKTVKERLGFKL